MGMLRLDIFTFGELQKFNSFINECEANGVTDMRFVREQVQAHITKKLRHGRVAMKKQERSAALKKKKELHSGNATKKSLKKVTFDAPTCKDCADTKMTLAAIEGEYAYFVCRKCRGSVQKLTSDVTV